MSKEATYVIGHKNPDTDSICSAMALAELKNRSARVISSSQGRDLNPRRSSYSITSTSSRRNTYPTTPEGKGHHVYGRRDRTDETPFHRVLELMREEEVRFMPVLDRDGRPRGVLTLMELTQEVSRPSIRYR
ncbi:MAG: DHH family phosphoesterase [Deltaproteobacteria bacterium]|nr:DHH family phosphoesterase [Deltaproteobacteria bacterium]